MGKENLDDPDRLVAAARTSGNEATSQPTPPLVILAIDDDPGMLRFYKVALAE